MTTIRANIGSTAYTVKPERVGSVSNQIIASDAPREVSVSEFIRLVASEGYPFTAALIATPEATGKVARKFSSFTSQQLLTLDIDNEAPNHYRTIDDTLRHCNGYGLRPFLVYRTYSSTQEKEKYRIVFRLNRTIYSVREAEIVNRMLCEVVPWSDPSCKDITHLFFGSITGPVVHTAIHLDNVVDPEKLVLAWASELAGNDPHRNWTRKVKNLAKEYGMVLKKGLPALLISPPTEEQCTPIPTLIPGEIDAETHMPQYIWGLRQNASQTDGNGGDIVQPWGGECENIFQFSMPYVEYMSLRGTKAKPTLKLLVQKIETAHRRANIYWDKHGDDIVNQCRLVRDLLAGYDDETTVIHHDEFFHMATTFVNISGGGKFFTQALEDYGHQAEKRTMQFTQIKKYGYEAQKCRNSTCRYLAECPHVQNDNGATILGLTFKRTSAIQVERPAVVSLEEIRNKLPEYLDCAINSNISVNVLRVDCGVGKTVAMINVMPELVQQGKRVVYAASTLRLLDETYNALRTNFGNIVPIFRIPELIEFLEQRDQTKAQKIRFWWKCGQYGRAAQEMRSWANTIAVEQGYMITNDREKYNTLSPEGKAVVDYRRGMEQIQSREPAIICVTHARALFSKVEADFTFIDEDILYRSLLKTGSFSLSQLEQCGYLLKTHGFQQKEEKQLAEQCSYIIMRLVKEIQAAGFDRITDKPNMNFSSVEILRKLPMDKLYGHYGKPSEMFDFLSSKSLAFLRPSFQANADTVHFVSRQELPARLGKVIIASATANQKVYNDFFGETKLNFIDTPHVQYLGDLIWHDGSSFANWRLDAEHNQETIRSICSILDYHSDIPIICTKKMKGNLPAQYQEMVFGTFGAMEGLNSTAGKNHVVIGISHKPDYVYKLMAYALGHRLGLDTVKENPLTEVERNGYRFRFKTYDDEFLREIQFYCLETELDQAIGRARLVNYDCKVHLYTNLPIAQCTLVRAS